LPDVRRTDARSAQIGCPDFIAHSFQVRSYSNEPLTPSSRGNLLAKNDWRLVPLDEPAEVGPEVAGVFFTESFSGA
jgi:hypothetical protein